MSTMKLAVMGAAGRMGQAIIRAIDERENTILAAAVERDGSPALGKDSGTLAGTGEKRHHHQ